MRNRTADCTIVDNTVALSAGDGTAIAQTFSPPDWGEVASIETGWERAYAQVSISTGNGGDADFANLLFDAGETAADSSASRSPHGEMRGHQCAWCGDQVLCSFDWQPDLYTDATGL